MPNVWSILKDEYAASIKTTFIFAIHFLGISPTPTPSKQLIVGMRDTLFNGGQNLAIG